MSLMNTIFFMFFFFFLEHFLCLFFQKNNFIDKTLKQSGLLENDDIVVSRRANSYVLTAVAKTKTYNSKKTNGLENMLKKAGAGNLIFFIQLFFDRSGKLISRNILIFDQIFQMLFSMEVKLAFSPS